MIRLSRSSSIGLLVAGAMLLVAPLAEGRQVGSAAGEFVVVSEPDTLLRGGAKAYYYPIARLSPGQVLRVTAPAEEGWVGVEYPADVGAYVPADSAEVSADGERVRLVAPSHLKAPNLNYGLRGSWKPVLDTPLPIGRELSMLVPGRLGEEVDAFLVEAPAGATAYVRADALREPTPDELRLARAARPDAPARPAEPEVQVPPVAAESDPSPAIEPDETGAEKTADEGTDDPDPLVIDQSTRSEGREAPAGPGSVEHLAALERAFEAARRAPAEEAAYDEVIEAIDKALEKGPDERVRQRLEQRRAWLALARDVRDQRRALDDRWRRFDERIDQLARAIDSYSKSGVYSVVGRLTTSVVYDGQNLPRMYRIVSVGEGAARTLGYLRPDAAPGLDRLVGDVVGVVGDPPSRAGLNVITPERVDRLEPSATASVPIDEP